MANRLSAVLPISKSFCNAWRKRTLTPWFLRQGTFRLMSWGRLSSRPLAGRTNSVWGLLGQHGFSTLSVPAGFTTQCFDRVRDATVRDGTRLAPPIPAKLPLGIMFFRHGLFPTDVLSASLGVRGGNKTPDSAARIRTGSRTGRP